MKSRIEYITLPMTIRTSPRGGPYGDATFASVLSYDNKRQEAELSDGRFSHIRWQMTPDEWAKEKRAWTVRGASEGAILWTDPNYQIKDREEDQWGWNFHP